MSRQRTYAIAVAGLLVLGGLAFFLRESVLAPDSAPNVIGNDLASANTPGATTAPEHHSPIDSDPGEVTALPDTAFSEDGVPAAGDSSKTDLLAGDSTPWTAAESPAVEDRDAIPRGWQLYSPTPAAFELSSDHLKVWQGAASARIDVVDQESAQRSFGGAMQIIRADAYRAKRVRFSAFVRTQGADAATIAIGADDQNGASVTGKFMLVDVRREFPVRGDSGWTLLAMVIEIPRTAVTLKFGAFLLGRGVLWADTARLEAVDATVPLTELPAPRVPPHLSDPPWIEGLAEMPVNMDFEDVEQVQR